MSATATPLTFSVPAAPPRRWESGAIWLAVFIALAIWNWDTIDSPPTRDQAVGHWMEANYLAETRFDFRSLLDEEGERLGGPRLYLVSVLPSLIAATMLLSGSVTATLVLYHLFTYACASLLVLVTFQMARPLAGALGAALVSAALVTTPLVSAQIALCGMDVPMAACGLLAARFVLRERFWLAVCAAQLGFLIKISGILITAAMLLYLVARCAWPQSGPPSRLSRRDWLVGAAITAAALALQVALFLLSLYLTNRT